MDAATVGREGELRVIDRFLMPRAGLRGLLIKGEAGIGKTTLWRRAVDQALELGAIVLRSRPTAAEAMLSFASLSDLLDLVVEPLLHELPDPQRRALSGALLLEEPQGAIEPRAVGLAVRGMLGKLCSQERVVVAIDDLQWVDAESAAALEFALRRLERGRDVAVVMARRIGRNASAEEFGPARAFEELVELAVGPLELTALHRIVRDQTGLALPRPVAVRVHKSTRGNPFYAIELARVLRSAGLPVSAAERLPVPNDVRDLLGERVSGSSASLRETLLTAAVAAHPSVGLLGAARGASADVEADIAEGQAADLIVLDDDIVRFVHPLLAEAVIAGTTRGRLREVHMRLAGLVDEPVERARHLALATEAPSVDVAAALDEAAASATARGAPATAAELFELAAGLTPTDARVERAIRLRNKAEQQLFAGSPYAARQTLDALLADLPAGSERARALVVRGKTCEDDLASGREYFIRALPEATEDEALQAQIHMELANYWIYADTGQALYHARTQLRLTRTTTNPRRLATAIAGAAWIETWAAEITPGLLEQGVELDRTYDDLPAWKSPADVMTTRCLLQGRLAEARECSERTLSRAVAQGDDFQLPAYLYYRSVTEWAAGNWAEGEQFAVTAREHAAQLGLVQTQGSVLSAAALIYASLGRLEDSRTAIEHGRRLCLEAGDVPFKARHDGAEGFLELSLGNVGRAAELLRDIPKTFRDIGYRHPAPHHFAADTIEALVAVGELDRAREEVDWLDREAKRLDLAWARGSAARGRGILLAAQGASEQGLAHLETALWWHERSELPFERARTLLATGTAVRRRKQKRAAREHLNGALNAFNELGAPLWAQKARAELARIGGRTTSAFELTETERRVAELAAIGKTNREIAAALFISEYTTKSNLARVYRKLGISRRAELNRVLQ